MHIDPCRIVSETNIRDVTVQMMGESLMDGKERGIIVYENKDGIFMTDIQKGEEHSIQLQFRQRGDILGIIHTHPNEPFDSLFSYKDIESMITSDFHFSAAVFDKGESGEVMIDVFTDRGLSSIQELYGVVEPRGDELDFLQRANDYLLECTLNLER